MRETGIRYTLGRILHFRYVWWENDQPMVQVTRIPGVSSQPRTTLIGRERDLDTVRSLLKSVDTRVLTLTGIGGSGKTRLALRLAADLASDYPQRIWVVELAPCNDGELVPIVVATSLGLREISSTTPIATIAAFLASRPTVLVLDNCEHLIDACAELADVLLSSCPDLRIIATSREPLQIPGERQYRVPPLKLPDPDQLRPFDEISASPAVRLFVTRAQDASPDFQLTVNNASLVVGICARLGGIPLALELAAARVGVIGVEQILARLNDSFRFLSGGSRVVPTRHQTLRAALDWSDALLSERERTVFRRLAIFAGEFQLEAAEAVCAYGDMPSSAVVDALIGLANKSLVVPVSGDRTAWYHLLEPVRQYALGHLVAHCEMTETEALHAHFYITMAETAEREMLGLKQEAWLNILEREQGNLRAALEWAQKQQDASPGLRLATALVPFWQIHGHLAEGLRWLRQALSRETPVGQAALRMRALAGTGRLDFFSDHSLNSRYAEAERLMMESLKLARELGDENGVATALVDLGMIHRLQGDAELCIVDLEDALTRFRELGDEHGIALVLLNQGSTIGHFGDTTRAIRLTTESLERFRALGDSHSMAIAQVLLSRLALERRDFEQARHLSLEAMTIHARLGDRWFVTFDLMALAEVLMAQEHRQEAVRLLGAAQALSEGLSPLVGGISFEELIATIDTLRREDWFDQAWADGHAFDLNHVIQFASTTLTEPPKCRDAVRSGKPSPVALTPRERQVARLLARGDTDRQIAEELFLAVGTVGVHVHHILQKLELRSRAQVADWLASHEPHETDFN